SCETLAVCFSPRFNPHIQLCPAWRWPRRRRWFARRRWLLRRRIPGRQRFIRWFPRREFQPRPPEWEPSVDCAVVHASAADRHSEVDRSVAALSAVEDSAAVHEFSSADSTEAGRITDMGTVTRIITAAIMAGILITVTATRTDTAIPTTT